MPLTPHLPPASVRPRPPRGLAVLALLGALQGQAAAQALVARRVTPESAAADLLSGADAMGGIGDWCLSNGVVTAIIDDIGVQQDVLQSSGATLPIQTEIGFAGGTLIDLGLTGRDNDQLASVSQVVNFNGNHPILYLPAGVSAQDPSLPSVLARTDAPAGTASLTVRGFAVFHPSTPLDPTIPVETEYTLRSGENVLRMRTTLTNRGPEPISIFSISDVILLARGGLLPFAPAPGRGFDTPQPALSIVPYLSLVGRVSPQDGILDPSAMIPAGEASYTFLSPEHRLLLSDGNLSLSVVGRPPVGQPIPPGGSVVYDRRIAVGDRNDVSSGSDTALPPLAAAYGIPTGSVRGRLVAPDGLPFRASLELSLVDLQPATPEPQTLLSGLTGDARPMPITQIAADSQRGGEFSATLTTGLYALTIRSEERQDLVPPRFVVQAGASFDLGTIALPAAGRLRFRISDAGAPAPAGLPAKVTIRGLGGTPDPRFGVPLQISSAGVPQRPQMDHASPALNVAYTGTGQGEVIIRPGAYRVFASRGLAYDAASADVTIGAGETREVELSIRKVVDTRGYVSADLHVHSARSSDSSVPPVHRILNFAAEGVEVIVATDHDVIFDYQPIIRSLGLESLMVGIPGTELTTTRPLFAERSAIGHWNGWPLAVRPHERKDGAPENEYTEPNVIFDRLRALGAKVVQLNHPVWDTLGFLSNIGFDPALPLHEPPNDFLLREAITGTRTRNLDFDVMEVYNSAAFSLPGYLRSRLVWFCLLNQGIRKAGTAVTDTHHVALRHAGFPRTYVAYDVADMARFDAAQFDLRLKEMRAFGTSGPFLEVIALGEGSPGGPGETVRASSGQISLHVRVQAPCWIPVEEVRVYANGEPVLRVPVPPGCPPHLRFDWILDLRPARDTHYIVEAGMVLPDDPGVPPPPPGLLMSILEPGAWPLAFTNPVFVDVDGDGAFDPPGLAPPATALESLEAAATTAAAAAEHADAADDLRRFRSRPEEIRRLAERVRVWTGPGAAGVGAPGRRMERERDR